MTDETNPLPVRLSLDEARDLALQALRVCGSGEEAAAVLAVAVVESEAQGYPAVGFAHLLDYCDALRQGRINGRAEPAVSQPRPAVLRVDGDGGIPHLGFQRVFEDLVRKTGTYGLALFLSHNAFTCAGLGYFSQRLAERGLLALAMTNGGPALMAGAETTAAVYCTNPVSFAVPRGEDPPLVIDQSCSATAYLNIKNAAREGRAIPDGWALDSQGHATSDAQAALRGTLLPAGGKRGANLALMVEILAAGLGGANWSVDAPSALEGSRSPSTGLFVLAIDPALPGDGALPRFNGYLHRLADEFGVYVPGERREASARRAQTEGIQVAASIIAALSEYARS
jgi:(2R)-3-sulfolactate dehydrogenase (NADP+)